MASEPRYRFSFFKAGDSEQVQFKSGADFVNIAQLDFKLWAALSCPVRGLAFDSRTLELIDADSDGRVRAPELINAIQWTVNLLRSPDSLLHGSDRLPLKLINGDTPEGATILNAAQTVLKGLARDDAAELTLEDMTAATAAFNAMPFNGDGVVTGAAARSDAERQLIADVVDCVGGVPDRSGENGVNLEQLGLFYKNIEDFTSWQSKRVSAGDILILREKTETALALLDSLKVKIDDYFVRCRLAAFDHRATAALNLEESAYLALAATDLQITCDEIRAFPLSRVAPDGALSLGKGVNPAWADRISAFSAEVVTPLLGARSEISEAQWHQLEALFAPFAAWRKERLGDAVEKLGEARIQEIAGSSLRGKVEELIAEDLKQEGTAEAIASVEKLVRFHRDLFRLVNNFVSFRDFFMREKPAIFQIGRLFLDRRECHLCIRVDDVAKHALMAHLSRAQLAYCECVRAKTGDRMTIAAAFTAGDSDNLIVGRNGVFFDNEGRDWDATITRLVDNPISIRQAFWSPYKKLLRFIEDQVAKRANESDAKANEKLTGGVTQLDLASTGAAPPPAAAPPPPKKLDIGVVAALGVAVGGITAALGVMAQAFFGLGFWMPLGILGLLLAISGPSMLIAWLKLRQRNIGPLLDASGWAVNSRARVNVALGASLTRVATVPVGSAINPVDPFGKRRRVWPWLLLLFVVVVGVLWFFGLFDPWLPSGLQRATLLSTPL